jgi:hypothetical protein
LIAGDQVPKIPLVEVVGKAPKFAPEQIGAICENAGVTFVLIVMVMVAVLAH